MLLRPRRTLRPLAVSLLVTVWTVASLLGPAPGGAAASEGRVAVGHHHERAGLTRFGVVDHNVELRQSAIDVALARAARSRATVVTLQEVCWWQAGLLREQHPGWTVGYQPGVEVARCHRPASLTDPTGLPDRDRRDSGLVVVWTGGSTGTLTTHLFAHQGSRRGPVAGSRDLRDGILCVTWAATGVVRHACSTHLLNASRFSSRRGTQYRQAREVRRRTAGWIAHGDLVVVGGDFNARPRSLVMNLLYAVDGRGRFQEATGCPRTVDVCRRSLGTTVDGGRTKIDYIFFSANRMSVSAPRRVRIVHTTSDHHLLDGWAHLRLHD